MRRESTIPMKTCTKCGRWFPPDLEHFDRLAISSDGLSYFCKACGRERGRRYRADNPEKVAEIKRLCYLKHREKNQARKHKRYVANCEQMREYNREYHRAHSESINEDARRWRAEHPENVAANHRRYSEANREEIAARRRRWVAANPEKATARNRNRKAHRRGASGSHTAADTRAQYARQHGRCFWCKAKVPWRKKHVDHVIPVALGGSNGPDNLVIACPTCNMAKHATHPMDFAGVLF